MRTLFIISGALLFISCVVEIIMHIKICSDLKKGAE